MGIPGFMTFMNKMNLIYYSVNINERVNTWMSKHPEESPMIVIDFVSLIYKVSVNKMDAICGGRPQLMMQSFKQILDNLTSTGCSLVFFSDLNTPESKAVTWMERQDNLFNIYTKFYNSITNERKINEILRDNNSIKVLKSTFYDMAVMARQYGEMFYATKHENDVQLAQYAKNHNALAIISSDTDFLIFDGPWLFWSIEHDNIYQLQVTEYDRNGLLKVLNLSRHLMSLWASLVGNDFTVGIFAGAFEMAANYLRDIVADMPDEHSHDVQKIAECFFERECVSIDMKQTILNSLISYDLNFESTIDDLFEQHLLETNNPIYPSYMAITSRVQGIPLPYYDMKHCSRRAMNLSVLIMAWSKRKAGFLLKHKNNNGDDDGDFKITFLAKKCINQQFEAHQEIPIYPNFDVSKRLLHDLYCGDRTLDGLEFKWNTLGWIMSFSKDDISKINRLPWQLRLIVATLHALVKKKLLSVEEADGILCTEMVVIMCESIDLNLLSYPEHPDAQRVRAAHVYINAFSYVRENFEIAGLLSEINEKIQFNGVYFQNMMESFVQLTEPQRQDHLKPVHKYRIYSNTGNRRNAREN